MSKDIPKTISFKPDAEPDAITYNEWENFLRTCKKFRMKPSQAFRGFIKSFPNNNKNVEPITPLFRGQRNSIEKPGKRVTRAG